MIFDGLINICGGILPQIATNLVSLIHCTDRVLDLNRTSASALIQELV